MKYVLTVMLQVIKLYNSILNCSESNRILSCSKKIAEYTDKIDNHELISKLFSCFI